MWSWCVFFTCIFRSPKYLCSALQFLISHFHVLFLPHSLIFLISFVYLYHVLLCHVFWLHVMLVFFLLFWVLVVFFLMFLYFISVLVFPGFGAVVVYVGVVACAKLLIGCGSRFKWAWTRRPFIFGPPVVLGGLVSVRDLNRRCDSMDIVLPHVHVWRYFYVSWRYVVWMHVILFLYVYIDPAHCHLRSSDSSSFSMLCILFVARKCYCMDFVILFVFPYRVILRILCFLVCDVC